MTQFNPAPPLDPVEGWDWPDRVPLPVALRVGDVRQILLLERSAPEQWQAWQARQLRDLLTHITAVSPAWREWVGTGLAQARPTDLSALPVLSREEFRAMVEREGPLRLPHEHGMTVAHSTSGSTGQPVRFHASALSVRVIRHHYEADHERHGRHLDPHGAPHAALGSRTPEHPGLEHQFARGDPWLGVPHVYTRRNLQFSFDEHARWLARLAPGWLAVNPTVLHGVLESFESGSAGVQAPRSLRQLLTQGATVEPRLRERARAVLGARIADRYSCEEIGPIALQCPHDDTRYHVCVSNAIVEVVDESGQPCAEGQTGRVLVTGLHQWASPALRYDIGDLAAWHALCTCGAQVPSLSNLLGRRRGLIRAPSGQRYFVRLSAADWLDIAPVREFRFVQDSLHEVRIELVVAQPLSGAQRAAVVAMLEQRVSPEFRFVIEERARIDWPDVPKRQDVVVLV